MNHLFIIVKSSVFLEGEFSPLNVRRDAYPLLMTRAEDKLSSWDLQTSGDATCEPEMDHTIYLCP